MVDGGERRLAVVGGKRKEGRMEGESRLWDGAFRVQYQLGSVPDRRVPMDSYRETDR
jgi:hypothetical protein